MRMFYFMAYSYAVYIFIPTWIVFMRMVKLYGLLVCIFCSIYNVPRGYYSGGCFSTCRLYIFPHGYFSCEWSILWHIHMQYVYFIPTWRFLCGFMFMAFSYADFMRMVIFLTFWLYAVSIFIPT